MNGNQLRAGAEAHVRRLTVNGVEDEILGFTETITDVFVTEGNSDACENESSDTSRTPKPKRSKNTRVAQRIWEKNDIIRKHERTWTRPEYLNNDFTPEELFENFYDDEVVTLFVEHSKLYALQKDGKVFDISVGEMRLFFGILLLSGYCSYSRYRMYWDNNADVYHPGVAQAMSRNRFEEILRYLHVCDHQYLDPNDKFAKVRPLWQMMNERWLKFFPNDAYVCVDESMVPYYGHHGTKQHIHGKPIRFGFKVWALCTRLGYLIQGEPYQGASTGNTEPEVGVGGSVVLNLLKKLPKDSGYSIYMDNFFTSVRLLEKLAEQGHDGTGTIRSNRIENAPVLDGKEVKKMERGFYDQVTDTNSGITIVRYKDNNIVTIASNRSGVLPLGKARRWSQAEKKRIEIAQPACVQEYNTYMGGVDRFDQNLAAYRVAIRMKKWYWQLIMYPLNASMNNAYQLYRLTPCGKEKTSMDFLGFIRSVVQTYIGKYTQRHPLGRIPQSKRKRVPDAVRLDGKDHFPLSSTTQIRCAECHKNTTKKCSKCNVGVHTNCFKKFHT